VTLARGSIPAGVDGFVLSLRGGDPIGYRATSYGHSTAISFESPLRPGSCAFAVAFDAFAGVLQGTTRVTEERAVTTVAFEPLFPAWARNYAFTTRFERTSAGFTASTRRGLASTREHRP
jgi:hypothetical protein